MRRSPRTRRTRSTRQERGHHDDWIKRQWTNPINLGVSRVIRLSPGRRISLALAGKVYADRGDSPSAGLRFTATYVLPR